MTWLADLTPIELAVLLLCTAAVLAKLALPIHMWVLSGSDSWEDPC